MLNTQAMIANLQLRSWTARKFDKGISAEVDQIHQAHDAGRYSKLLVEKSALDPITRHCGKIREFHYKVTLPWGDNGDRLLPAKQYMDYTRAMRDFKAEADRLTRQFVSDYPRLVAAARTHLGTMYSPSDYPKASEIGERFGVIVEFLPVPDAEDFRVDLGKKQVAEIRAGILETVKERQQNAAKECWNRLHEVMQNLSTMMAKDKPIFRDTLVSNIEDTVQLLPKLNIMEDKELDTVCKDVGRFLAAGVTPAELRKNPKLRDDVKARSEVFLRLIASHV
jgi:hypothetical protein